MASGGIFYSSVDPNLQNELNARANAGFTSRTNRNLFVKRSLEDSKQLPI